MYKLTWGRMTGPYTFKPETRTGLTLEEVWAKVGGLVEETEVFQLRVYRSNSPESFITVDDTLVAVVIKEDVS